MILDFKKRLLIDKLGFSMIEVMVVISVITFGMLGLISLVVQNIQVQSVNKNFLIASMLSQEGLELVRNIRDENWLDIILEEDDWRDGLIPAGEGLISTFTIEYDGNINDGVDSIDEAGALLYLDASSNYNHQNIGGGGTIFKMLITIDDSNPNYIDVSSHVRWEERGKTFDYTAVTYLYNWR